MTYSLQKFDDGNPEVAAVLRELRDTHVIFVPNNGNAGDSLIAAATYQILHAYNISYTVETNMRRLSRIVDKVVLLGGGGNLVPLYGTMASILKAVAHRNNRVVLLPHSIRGNIELLSHLSSDVTLFCREGLSLSHARRVAVGAQVRFGHDLGIFLDPHLLEQERFSEEWRDQFEDLVKKRTGQSPEQLRGSAMQCLRGGRESTVPATGKNFDASTFFTFGVAPGDAEKAAWMLLEFVRLGSRITTNRLHIAIAALLVGVETTMLDNSYGKLSGVYESSLKNKFGIVRFAGSPVTDDPFQQD